MKTSNRILYSTVVLVASSILAFTTGCASGGFKLTREYARWVNSKQIILRVVLFILTLPVYAVTLIIDAVIFNTVDFWEGRVSQGNYHFKKGEHTYFVKHEILPSQLKRSTILVKDIHGARVQEIVLKETQDEQIEMFVNGILKTRVSGLSAIPVATLFDKRGLRLGQKLIPAQILLAKRQPQ